MKRNEIDPSNISLSDWMRDMPPRIQQKPLINLCIPGSHDSAAYNLDRCGPIAYDQPRWLRILAKLFPPVKRIVFNWSVCQRLSLTQQLESGVRYFDLRLAREGGGGGGDIRTVHGLCGPNLDSLLSSVDTFLRLHPKEVVLLDFNHFFNMDWRDHRRVFERLLATFATRCCPAPPFVEQSAINLSTCWAYRWRVIIFYQIPFHVMEKILALITTPEGPIPIPYLFWTMDYIKSPWPNTSDLDRMIDYVEYALENKESLLPPDGGFFVSQGVLTPKPKDVLLRPFSTLRDRMGVPATEAIVDWLGRSGPAIRSALNIAMTDFVETQQFCRAVVDLNR